MPLPVPGVDAVFQSTDRKVGAIGRTSTVERVVMRVARTRVGSNMVDLVWEEFTGRCKIR